MRLKAGMWVLLPNGQPGVVVHFSGALGGGFQAPDGSVDSFNVPDGQVLCHEIDSNGETVMMKHPEFMKFVSKDVLVAISELKELPEGRIPQSRRAG